MAIRIIVADPDPGVRRLLVAHLSLENDMTIVAEVQDGLELLAAAERLGPEAILVAGVLFNPRLVQALQGISSFPVVVVLVTYREELRDVRSVGAMGCVLGESMEHVVRTIRRAARLRLLHRTQPPDPTRHDPAPGPPPP